MEWEEWEDSQDSEDSTSKISPKAKVKTKVDKNSISNDISFSYYFNNRFFSFNISEIS